MNEGMYCLFRVFYDKRNNFRGELQLGPGLHQSATNFKHVFENEWENHLKQALDSSRGMPGMKFAWLISHTLEFRGTNVYVAQW